VANAANPARSGMLEGNVTSRTTNVQTEFVRFGRVTEEYQLLRLPHNQANEDPAIRDCLIRTQGFDVIRTPTTVHLAEHSTERLSRVATIVRPNVDWHSEQEVDRRARERGCAEVDKTGGLQDPLTQPRKCWTWFASALPDAPSRQTHSPMRQRTAETS